MSETDQIKLLLFGIFVVLPILALWFLISLSKTN